MKNTVLKISGFLLIALFAVSSCMEDPIKDAQESYDYSKIAPVVLDGIQGPALAIQTFTGNYTINYYRGGSKWNWSATDATVKSVSEDTRTATIEFKNYPASGKAIVSVTETTMGGITSDPVTKSVTVQKYCPLASGAASLAGSWEGTDAYYPSVIAMTASGSDLSVTGMNKGFIEDWWGEAIVKGGTFTMKWNLNGTLDIPRQYIFTTVYKGDEYDYEIKGSGTWDNCGSKPTMLITYDIYYPGDAKGIAATYASYLDNIPYLTATITLK